MEVYFGWVGLGGHFLWVGGGIFWLGGSGWERVKAYFWWVEMGGGEWRWSLVLAKFRKKFTGKHVC